MGRFLFQILTWGFVFSIKALPLFAAANESLSPIIYDYHFTRKVTFQLVANLQVNPMLASESIPESEYQSEMYVYLASRAQLLFERIGRADLFSLIQPCLRCGGLAAKNSLSQTIMLSSRGFEALFENENLEQNRDLIVDFILAHELSHLLMDAYQGQNPARLTINGMRKSEQMRLRGNERAHHELHAEIDVMAVGLLEEIGYLRDELLIIPGIFLSEAEAFARAEALANFGSESKQVQPGWAELLAEYTALVEEAFEIRGGVMINSLGIPNRHFY